MLYKLQPSGNWPKKRWEIKDWNHGKLEDQIRLEKSQFERESLKLLLHKKTSDNLDSTPSIGLPTYFSWFRDCDWNKKYDFWIRFLNWDIVWSKRFLGFVERIFYSQFWLCLEPRGYRRPEIISFYSSRIYVLTCLFLPFFFYSQDLLKWRLSVQKIFI